MVIWTPKKTAIPGWNCPHRPAKIILKYWLDVRLYMNIQKYIKVHKSNII